MGMSCNEEKFVSSFERPKHLKAMDQNQKDSSPREYDLDDEFSIQNPLLAIRRHQKIEMKHKTALVAVCSSILTAIILSLLTGFWVMGQRNSRPVLRYDELYSIHAPHTEGCGDTVADAKARNCRFDELSDLWLPQRCSQKYEDEYLRSNGGKPFDYWTDITGQHLVLNRSELAGGVTYYSTTRDHLAHCEFNLYRFADSLTTGELVGHVDDFAGHLTHCAKILSQFAYRAPDIDNIDVDTVSTFGFC